MITITDASGWWAKHLAKYYKSQLGAIEREYPNKKSLIIDCGKLLKAGKYGLEYSDKLLDNPARVMEDIKGAITEHALIGNFELTNDNRYEDLNIRFQKITSRNIKISDINTHHINKFVSFEAIVRTISDTKAYPAIMKFQCLKCSSIYPDIIQEFGTWLEPFNPCPECGNSRNYRAIPSLSKLKDYRSTLLIEPNDGMRNGEKPENILAVCFDDMAQKKHMLHPGEKIICNGIVRVYQKKAQDMEIYVEINSYDRLNFDFEDIHLTDEDIKEIEEKGANPDIKSIILKSIAPSIMGMVEVKEGIMLALFSGVPKNPPDGSRLRGDIHILIVGDPGIAKSQLLRYASMLAPRAMYATGKGASGVGLTASTVKIEKFGNSEWIIEAGVLPLADGGIACVDEIDKMEKEDRNALHSALEGQQKIDIAKAGLHASLNTRCSLLCAANPKSGKYDRNIGIPGQINLDTPFINRMDLIFALQDIPNAEKDYAIANHISNIHQVCGFQEAIKSGTFTEQELIDAGFCLEMDEITPEFDVEFFRKYIAYARRMTPVLTPEAKDIFMDYYLNIRGIAKGDVVPITARQEEALHRLGEAHARMRLSKFVTADDANAVVELVDFCIREVAFDEETKNYDFRKITVGISSEEKRIQDAIRETIWAYNGDGIIRDYCLLPHLQGHPKLREIPQEKLEKIIENMIRSSQDSGLYKFSNYYKIMEV